MGSCFSSAHKTASASLRSSHAVAKPSSKASATGKKSAAVPANILGRPFKNVEDDYDIGRELGHGLYGVTRVAKDKKTRELYACKTINKRRLTRTNFANVKRELAILEKVSSHPNVATLIAAYEDATRIHFILELCDAGMLYDSLTAKGHYSERDAADVFRTMVEIVHFFHERGVMHRDLKLENFMLKMLPSAPLPGDVPAALDGDVAGAVTNGKVVAVEAAGTARPAQGDSAVQNGLSDGEVTKVKGSKVDGNRGERGEGDKEGDHASDAHRLEDGHTPLPEGRRTESGVHPDNDEGFMDVKVEHPKKATLQPATANGLGDKSLSLTKSSQLMAIDFGLSTFFEQGQRFSEIVGSAYYVAPEVLRKDYSMECDVWSAGVILYMLLCGVPPFWDVSEVGICDAVLKGEYDLADEPWPSISESAKDLVRRMLEVDPGKRITTKQILEHPWARRGGCAPTMPFVTPVHKRLQQFCLMSQIKRHALHIIADCCLDEREVDIIRSRFDRIDVDKDGLITADDVWAAVQRLKVPVSRTEVQAIFEAADLDKSGALDFSEYASAIMVKRLDPKRIRRAFDHFDREGRGYITIDDLRAALSTETNTDVIEKIMADIDVSKDGKIDFEEFSRMMREGMDTESNLNHRSVSYGGGRQLSELTMSRLEELYRVPGSASMSLRQ